MKRISFNNTLNEFRETVVEINGDEYFESSVINLQRIVLIVSNHHNSQRAVRVFHRESGLRIDEPSCDPFLDPHSLNFHPFRSNLLFVGNKGYITVCDLDSHLQLKTYSFVMWSYHNLQLQVSDDDSIAHLFYFPLLGCFEIVHTILDSDLNEVSSTALCGSHSIETFVLFGNFMIASLTFDNLFKIWNLETNEKLHEVELPRLQSESRFIPSSQYIILCLSFKVMIFSNLSFQLIKEIDIPSAINFGVVNAHVSSDDASVLFAHQSDLKGVDIINLENGSIEFRPFPNQDAHKYYIYQGLH